MVILTKGNHVFVFTFTGDDIMASQAKLVRFTERRKNSILKVQTEYENLHRIFQDVRFKTVKERETMLIAMGDLAIAITRMISSFQPPKYTPNL